MSKQLSSGCLLKTTGSPIITAAPRHHKYEIAALLKPYCDIQPKLIHPRGGKTPTAL